MSQAVINILLLLAGIFLCKCYQWCKSQFRALYADATTFYAEADPPTRMARCPGCHQTFPAWILCEEHGACGPCHYRKPEDFTHLEFR